MVGSRKTGPDWPMLHSTEALSRGFTSAGCDMTYRHHSGIHSSVVFPATGAWRGTMSNPPSFSAWSLWAPRPPELAAITSVPAGSADEPEGATPPPQPKARIDPAASSVRGTSSLMGEPLWCAPYGGFHRTREPLWARWEC